MLFYIIMSLKVYNGIKFKSKSLPEIISQLYAIKEQAKKNSNDYLMNDGGRIVHLMVKNKIIDNFEDIYTKEFTSDDYWDVDRLITASLDSRWRDRMEPNFNFNVCVIPWTDGNFYGIYYDDDIEENRALLNDIADEYHYQNQTDQPDDIDDEEWSERRDVWDEIFDKYTCPSDAGFIYEIVTSSDINFDMTEKALKVLKDKHMLAWAFECKFKTDDEKEIKNLFAQIYPVLCTFEDVHTVNMTWFSSDPTVVIYCKDDAAKKRVEILLKCYSMLDYTFKQKHVRSEYFTEEYRNYKNKIEKDFVDD